MKVKNPILRGFNPDPSIIRVGEDYYIATSTFEWFPGVQIHHSRDLANWQLITRPLDRISQLDLSGVCDSGGVWAPCLSYSNGMYYLVYSKVKNFDGIWKDIPNYLVTSSDINGPWSEPVYLNSRGFDASFFHDDDGRIWYLIMQVDHRRNKLFGGIILQEYDPVSKKLTGPVYPIFEGSGLGNTEGPHLYKRNGYYYLLVAEGGTEYDHAMTMARSKSVTGPYELHPEVNIVTTRHDPNWPLQKAGHGDLVETPEGKWFAVCLVGRPLSMLGRCTLGRETAIHPMEWREDDWLYPIKGELRPFPEFEIAGSSSDTKTDGNLSIHDDFDHPELNVHYQTLRVPFQPRMGTLHERKGFLRLYGRESLSSLHFQSMIARRVQSFEVSVSTSLEFDPDNFQQMAGLTFYYNTYHFHYLHLTADDQGNRVLSLLSCDRYRFEEPMGEPICVPGQGAVHLKGEFIRDVIQFYYSLDGQEWTEAGPELDGSILSDDYIQDAENRYRAAFTGSFAGLCCQDLSGLGKHADFDYFEYNENAG